MSKKIIFMGTPDFAVASLKQLLNKNIEVVAVVTAPDRPAGRGQKMKASAVKTFALSKDITVLQPEKLKHPDFIDSLKELNADLFVVVAFRMLPEIVWDMPKLGTINLHGSLLPKYRGAAPINWAVINGDTITGVTTFFIEKSIDTGHIIDTDQINIEKNDTAGIVHDKLMDVGAVLLSKTVLSIFEGTAKAKPQPNKEATHAPKLFKPDCLINWNESSKVIFNKIKGLSPYPTAYTILYNETSKKNLKLFLVDFTIDNKNNTYQIKVKDEKVFFGCNNGWIEIIELQLEGKTRMTTVNFIKGFDLKKWTLTSPTNKEM